jgi:hypothetical protein
VCLHAITPPGVDWTLIYLFIGCESLPSVSQVGGQQDDTVGDLQEGQCDWRSQLTAQWKSPTSQLSVPKFGKAADLMKQRSPRDG